MEFDELKEYISIARKQKLRKLNLSNKEIDKLPDEIIKLSNVRSIDLSYNNLKEFPIQLTRMPQLQSLLLFRNEITSIPKEIGYLRQLTLLDISFNKIEELPEEIGQLFDIQTFDIGYNKLNKLPLTFINLTGLKKLYLEKNPMVFPPEKVIKRGLYATMHYLFGEIRKKEASKVTLQVYNFPQPIENAFVEYLKYFNDLIASDKKHDITFDVKFIKHDYQEDFEIEPDLSNYLNEFLHFIKSNIKDIKKTKDKNLKEDVLDYQFIELRDQIKDLSASLKEKSNEINNMQKKLDSFYSLLEKKISKKK